MFLALRFCTWQTLQSITMIGFVELSLFLGKTNKINDYKHFFFFFFLFPCVWRMILKMPNISHGCLQQDISFTNRTKSAQSEYSFLRIIFWHPALEVLGVLACLVLLFFLVICVSYSALLCCFFFLVLTIIWNRRMRYKFHSEPSEAWCVSSVGYCSMNSQIWQTNKLKPLVSVVHNNPEC